MAGWAWTSDLRPPTIATETSLAVTIYLDCNATTPLDPAVWEAMRPYLLEEFGNAGSRTHQFGARAKDAVQRARHQVAAVVAADPTEVVFTSGATESNNIAILGLAPYAEREQRRHIVSTGIEHKAVLEPLEQLERRGFEVTLVPPTPAGAVDTDRLLSSVRPETSLVSVMHVNNETGVIQPIEEIAAGLSAHPAYLHVDAAQGYGKELDALRNPRIDFISISAHKLYGPKGVGALVLRRRDLERPPVAPLMFGGGQERGIRPGTLAVHLIVALGEAAELSERDNTARKKRNERFLSELKAELFELDPRVNGDLESSVPHVLNISFPGVDSEAVMLALKEVVAISNGSACTSHDYRPSHVLEAMQLPVDVVEGAIRISWCHLSESPDWGEVVQRIRSLR